jgi:hypothetical protein
MADVFDFQAAKNKKENLLKDPFFQKYIDKMDIPQLLEEMIRYHEQKPKDKELVFSMIRGIILFEALERKCFTEEVRLLAGSYKRHLQHEIAIKRSKK